MVVELRQAGNTFQCSKCTAKIIQGSIYLRTACMYNSNYYCRSCTRKRNSYCYDNEDFKHFRPEANYNYYDFKDEYDLDWDQIRTLRELYKI